MASEADYILLQSLVDDLKASVDGQTLPKVRNELKLIKKLEAERIELNEKLSEINRQFDGYIQSEFQLADDGDVLELLRIKLEKEQDELKLRKDEYNALKTKKSVTTKEYNNCNAELSKIQQSIEDIENKILEFRSSREKECYKLINQLMSIVYKYDKEGKCVAITLDENRHVEMALEVNKENMSDDERREEFWDQLERTTRVDV
jgi:chromosome segregation ATPase